ncbi:MAG TPA: hypothetical protein VKN18_13805 [Blastocatellia bacterium]|nr:hypothetical protein [Blastocatellia bacterium]
MMPAEATKRLAVVSACRLVCGVCVAFILVALTQAQPIQIPEPPLPVDPRPLSQLLSDAEKATLSDSNPKKVIDAYLKIADVHLQGAFNSIKANNDRAAEQDLDIYSKAATAALKEAVALQENRRSISKKIEQALYKQIKTLESIERLFPEERERFADAALKHAKQLRVQALNEAFASGDVLKDPDEETKPKSAPKAKDSPPKNQSVKPPLTRFSSARMIGLASVRQTMPDSVSASTFIDKSTVPQASLASSLLQISGDYMTEEEDDHVREAQAPDARVKVFMHIADRRLKAITGTAAVAADKKEAKKIEEEEKEWGAVPKVSKAELLRHYSRAISECMAKLEDAYERNPKSSALPKALALLRDSTDKHLVTLRALKPELKTDGEVDAASGAIYEAETANKGARDGLSKH